MEWGGVAVEEVLDRSMPAITHPRMALQFAIRVTLGTFLHLSVLHFPYLQIKAVRERKWHLRELPLR